MHVVCVLCVHHAYDCMYAYLRLYVHIFLCSIPRDDHFQFLQRKISGLAKIYLMSMAAISIASHVPLITSVFTQRDCLDRDRSKSVCARSLS